MTAARKAPTYEWIVLNAIRGGTLECRRCGQSYTPNYPVPIDIMSAIGKAFEKSHRGCKPHPEGDTCAACGKRGHAIDDCPTRNVHAMTPEAWLAGTDTGLSSKTIWCVMMGRRDFGPMGRWGPNVPLDPDDFGRCHRLLKRFPQWRERIGEMRTVPGWAGLADAWPELEVLYEAERPSGRCPRLYARMLELGRQERATAERAGG